MLATILVGSLNIDHISTYSARHCFKTIWSKYRLHIWIVGTRRPKNNRKLSCKFRKGWKD